ncbi:MAG: hypothetical protein JWO62_3428 [Acidimicrobiaceae bacterium]|jgi:hypothetical protein|nr:hypothetical protein [Acidimicrobiaceae bacterium]
MKGRWAAGIVPRNFAWIVQDRLAVSERPGGYAPHHRRVRRQEEILWLEVHGFTRVVSLLPSSHNLHAYEELGLPSAHFGLPPQADVREVLAELYPAMLGWIRGGERLIVHQEELGDRVAGVVAGFLCWCGLLPDPARAIYAVEQLLRRQMGSAGRAIVVLAPQLPPPTAAMTSPSAMRAGAAPAPSGAPEALLTTDAPAAQVTVPPEVSAASGAPPPAADEPAARAVRSRRTRPATRSPAPSDGAVEPKEHG